MAISGMLRNESFDTLSGKLKSVAARADAKMRSGVICADAGCQMSQHSRSEEIQIGMAAPKLNGLF
jgi:hypothetical protein